MEPLGLSTKDAFAAIPCGKTKGWELIKRGDLKTYKVDGSTRVTTESVRAFVERQLQEQQEVRRAQGLT